MHLTDRVKTLQQHAIDCNSAGGLEEILDTFAILMVEDFRELIASKCSRVPFSQAKILTKFDAAVVKDYYTD